MLSSYSKQWNPEYSSKMAIILFLSEKTERYLKKK